MLINFPLFVSPIFNLDLQNQIYRLLIHYTNIMFYSDSWQVRD